MDMKRKVNRAFRVRKLRVGAKYGRKKFNLQLQTG